MGDNVKCRWVFAKLVNPNLRDWGTGNREQGKETKEPC